MKQKDYTKTFEQVLLKYLKANYLKKTSTQSEWNQKDFRYFSKGVIALNEGFTQSRQQTKLNYFQDPVLRSGYLSYFLIVNAMKMRLVLSKYHPQERLKKIYSIADIGAGPLTMTLGWLFWFLETHGTQLTKPATKDEGSQVTVYVDVFEQNKKIIIDGMRLIQEYLNALGLTSVIKLVMKPVVCNLNRVKFKANNYDYVLCGNVFNEYHERQDQWELAQNLIRAFSGKYTKIIILEPASKKISRDLQALRDLIIEKTKLGVIAPCLHQHQCPLNITAKGDWCNFQERWQAPGFIKRFDELTQLKKTYLMYSFLFLASSVVIEDRPVNQFVAISDLMMAKGRREVVGCGGAGRIRFIRSNKDESEHNNDFGRIHRGVNFEAPEWEAPKVFTLDMIVSVKKQIKIVKI
jgi:hypothetical protein